MTFHIKMFKVDLMGLLTIQPLQHVLQSYVMKQSQDSISYIFVINLHATVHV